MSKPKGAGTWILLSQVLANVPFDQKDAEAKKIVLGVADGLEHIRYVGAYELPWPMEAFPDVKVTVGPRSDQLPEAVLRYGEVDGAIFSALYFDGRVWASQIELFVPDVVAGDQAASYRKPSARLVTEEAERRRVAGLIPSDRLKKDFAAELALWLKHEHGRDMKPKAVENAIGTSWKKA